MDNYGLFFPSHSMVCYHEPRIHDHELYFQLRNLNLLLLLPIALIGILCNACAMVSHRFSLLCPKVSKTH
uniref:G_PROTEIN_RECEP_F1_2 domain-containing protein n=1 Tax=Caenorhabditis tropicalis TaxID=1561998 RepID=A0A1I7T5N7_9PELO